MIRIENKKKKRRQCDLWIRSELRSIYKRDSMDQGGKSLLYLPSFVFSMLFSLFKSSIIVLSFAPRVVIDSLMSRALFFSV